MLSRVLTAAAAAATAAAAAVTDANPLTLTVAADGTYSVAVAGWTTLTGGATRVMSRGGWLALTPAVAPPAAGGADAWGTYTETAITWSAPATGAVLLTRFKVYDAAPAIAFEQVALQALTPGGGSSNNVSTVFPSWVLPAPSTASLGVMQWHGAFFNDGVNGPAWTTWDTAGAAAIRGGLEGGPLVLFDAAAQGALIFSPASAFMTTNLAQFDGTVHAGVLGSVAEIPAGFSTSTVLWYGAGGINPAIMQWGAALLAAYGKDASGPQQDFTANYLTYNTDVSGAGAGMRAGEREGAGDESRGPAARVVRRSNGVRVRRTRTKGC